MKTALRRDHEHLAHRIEQTNVPHVCAEELDRGRKHLFQPLAQALRTPEAGAQLVEPDEFIRMAAPLALYGARWRLGPAALQGHLSGYGRY